MTNKEKAKEIANAFIDAAVGAGAFSGALEMAEWKDDILRKERDNAIKKFNEYYDKKLNLAIASRYIGIVFLIDRVLGEDSSDKLHCTFVSID